MSNELYDFNLGHSTAYAYAKASGDLPEGMTPEEYGELLAAYATVGQTAVDAKDAAVAAKTAAQTAATTATNKASEATTAAQTATTKAGEASQSASQASTSAQTASTKASEASQSASTATTKATEATTAAGTATTAKDDAVTAKNAAETAQGKAETAQAAAESVAESIPSDYSQLSEDVSDLKENLNQSNNELFRVSGYLNQNYVKGRQRYVDAGVEKFANHGRWISPAQGEYIELKSGDVIVIHQSARYHFRVCYSTDNKVTWIMSAEQIGRFTVPSDGVGWIPVIAATTATDEDVETILNDHVVEIIRDGVNLVGSVNANVNGVMDALNISPNSGFQIEAIKDGTTFNYVNTTATENAGTEKLFEIPCVKDDVFRLTFDSQAMISPENFDDYFLIVREIDQSETSPLRNVVFKLSELQTAADFTVYYANTKKIIANINLKRSSTTVSTGYYEEIKYSVTVIKVLEQNDVYTEAGEAWEV